MKILVSSASYIFGDELAGGEHRVSYNIVKGLLEKGHSVTLLSPKVSLKKVINAECIEVGGYRFKPSEDYFRYRLNWWLFSIRSIFKARKLLKKKEFDIIHHIRPANYGMFSLFWIFKMPFIYGPVTPSLRIKDEDFKEFETKGIKNPFKGIATRCFNLFHEAFAPPLWRTTLKNASLILVQLKKAMEDIPEEFRYKARIVGLGVNTGFFSPSSEDRVPTILFLANLTRQKGLEYLLRAMPLVLEEVPSCVLNIVGDGPGRNYYKRLVNELDLKRSVLFFGMVPHRETVNFYRKAWVYCLPSIVEPAANTLLEAMSCGRPVVATEGGGNREIIGDGDTGFLVSPKNPEALAESLIKILTDKELRRKMGKKARKRAEEEFNLKKLIDKIEEAYREVV
jgi:glycosyltransferase involved in cell wall biosynthesis